MEDTMDIVTTITVGDTPLTLFGVIQIETHSIELNYQPTSIEGFQLGQQFVQQPQKYVFQVFDMQATAYTVYGCFFHNCRSAFSSSSVTVINGSFDRLIKERRPDQLYNSVLIHFGGIEKFFPLETIQATVPDEFDGSFTYSRSAANNEAYQLINNINCSPISLFEGIVVSDNLTSLELKQQKFLKLIFKEAVSVNIMIEYINKIKLYFEFVVKQEINLDIIRFKYSDNPLSDAELLFDGALHSKTIIRTIQDHPYHMSNEVLFNGLKGWLKEFDAYSDAIKIWKKTIYNTNISEEDVFIWRCQAVELMCTINPIIFPKAEKYKQEKQSSPNIENFLMVANYDLNIGKDCFKDYLRDVKLVRDKLTHNNPKKQITANQIWNSCRLIEYFLISIFSWIMNIDGVSSAVLLRPKDN